MPITQSLTQVQIYAVSLAKKLIKKFPDKKYKLAKLTERTSLNSTPEHFVITKKGKLLRKKAIEGISSNGSANLFVWENDEGVKKFIATTVNELNEHSLIKFKIEFK